MLGSTRSRLRGNDFLEETSQPPTSRFALQLLQLNTLEVERARNDVDHFLLLVGGSVEVAEDEVARESSAKEHIDDVTSSRSLQEACPYLSTLELLDAESFPICASATLSWCSRTCTARNGEQ